MSNFEEHYILTANMTSIKCAQHILNNLIIDAGNNVTSNNIINKDELNSILSTLNKWQNLHIEEINNIEKIEGTNDILKSIIENKHKEISITTEPKNEPKSNSEEF